MAKADTSRFGHLSRGTTAGLALLAAEIRSARKILKMTETDLASRAGISRDTLRAIEAGKPTVAIGLVFEAATIVGIDLFGDQESVARRLGEARTRLALLPARISRTDGGFDDAF